MKMENKSDLSPNLSSDFYQTPIGEDQQKAMAQVRNAYQQLDDTLKAIVIPVEPRRAAIARTKLEEACMFSIKAICTA